MLGASFPSLTRFGLLEAPGMKCPRCPQKTPAVVAVIVILALGIRAAPLTADAQQAAKVVPGVHPRFCGIVIGKLLWDDLSCLIPEGLN